MINRRKFNRIAGLALTGSVLLPEISLSAGENERLKVGQIGTGHFHAESKMQALRRLKDIFDVVGVAEPDSSLFEKNRNKSVYSGLKWLTADEMLRTKGLQAVLVETDLPDLLPRAERCIEAGLPIHLDKPAGKDFDRFKKIMSISRQKNLIVQMGYMFRYNPAFEFCLQPKPKVLVSFYGYGNITGDWYAKPDSFYNQQESISRKQAFSVIGDSVISQTPDEQFWKDRLNLFYLYCRQQGLWPQLIAGHEPLKESGWFKFYEPLRMVNADYPPTLLLHGEKDTDVPFGQSVLMSEVLKHKSIPFEFIRSSDWGHGFDGAGTKNEEVRKAFDRVLSFLGEYIR